MDFDAKVAPDSTALLVIDVQNDFCAKGGAVDRAGGDVSPMQAVMPAMKHLISKARESGVALVFVKAIYDDRFLSEAMRERRAEKGPVRQPTCLSGTWGADFYQIGPEDGEVVVEKHRYSAFIRTGLDEMLKSRRIKTLVVMGVTTHVCVESTVRDAFMLDYHVVVAEDCVASQTTRTQKNSLELMRKYFADVVPSLDIVEAWAASTLKGKLLAR
ncbi:MAG: cysteine hydrolase [Nitrososphaerota archaeon]|nr:cysteine hydrolase [Nitrososphaerota archaeon]MDG6939487.1 cysteine hydrolase [Nitrososphaerota archaeon]